MGKRTTDQPTKELLASSSFTAEQELKNKKPITTKLQKTRLQAFFLNQINHIKFLSVLTLFDLRQTLVFITK